VAASWDSDSDSRGATGANALLVDATRRTDMAVMEVETEETILILITLLCFVFFFFNCAFNVVK